MQTFVWNNLNTVEKQQALTRPAISASNEIKSAVENIVKFVQQEGDKALFELTEKFDKIKLDSLIVTPQQIAEATARIPEPVKMAIQNAKRNITAFHEAQKPQAVDIETQPGVCCQVVTRPINRVGLYIPGGSAPLFSTVLMLATPAKIAGCKEIVLCTPPDRSGHVNPAILMAAKTAGVSQIFKIGGVQAIGAMAYGTESVPRVSKIFGPGNQYVMAAKQHVCVEGVAIDMPAGPSEVCVVADAHSNAKYVAADLLSQAEHGPDSQVLLITTSEATLHAVTREVEEQLASLPRKDIAAKALANSRFVLVHNNNEAMALCNAYAPEHLILATDNYAELAQQVVNAGSVFLGKYACESAGDYASGTNHTLPTHGYAMAYSGVNLDSYMRKITFQHLDQQGLKSIGRAVELMAHNEQLDAHRNAMTVRLKDLDINPFF